MREKNVLVVILQVDMLNAMVIVKLVIGNYEETCEDYSFWGYFRGVFPL